MQSALHFVFRTRIFFVRNASRDLVLAQHFKPILIHLLKLSAGASKSFALHPPPSSHLGSVFVSFESKCKFFSRFLVQGHCLSNDVAAPFFVTGNGYLTLSWNYETIKIAWSEHNLLLFNFEFSSLLLVTTTNTHFVWGKQTENGTESRTPKCVECNIECTKKLDAEQNVNNWKKNFSVFFFS